MRGLKRFFVFIAAGMILYATGMIVVRLKMTETAYQFEEAKTYERSLREEQQRLRAKISFELPSLTTNLKDFQEPDPRQIVRIPEVSKR